MENNKIISDNSRSIGLVELIIPDLVNAQKSQLSVRGTSFVISPNGKFATCAHVYDGVPEDQKIHIWVNVPDQLDDKKLLNYRRFKVQLVAIDREQDVAILEVVDSAGYKFVQASNFGNLENAVEGDALLILGYPLANEILNSGLGITMTADQCIASAIKRRALDGDFHSFMVDTHINNGSSGSPVFLKRTGEIIGIASGKVFSARVPSADGKNLVEIPANIGICQPINNLRKLINIT